MRHIFQGITYHVYDAVLMLCFRKGRLYRVLESAEPIRATDKNILAPSKTLYFGSEVFLQSLSMIIYYFQRFPKVVVELLTFITERGEI